MGTEEQEYVWVFHGANGRFTSGVFTTRKTAEKWINENTLTGILTKYPVNQGVYNWSINNGYFKVKKEEQKSPDFIQRFTTASQEHYHYEDGGLDPPRISEPTE